VLGVSDVTWRAAWSGCRPQRRRQVDLIKMMAGFSDVRGTLKVWAAR
jgi:hypothetical protein